MSYKSFKNRWLGKRVDYDRVYGYQCVDLIKQYADEEFGLKAGVWGNAVDYWYNPSPALLKKFDRLSTKNARIGDIVIFRGVNNNPYGHIGIADRSSGLFRLATLEQNGATGNGSGVRGDAIRVRNIFKTRMFGVLRPKTAKPVLRMPAVGSRIQLFKGISRTTWKSGTTKVAGRIYPTDSTFVYTVRGYDPLYAGRVIINSRTGGGNGVALALYYTNGKNIGGWKKL